MKYLVTGATGFIGLELCRQILQSGHQLIALSRLGETLPDGTPTRSIDFRREQLAAADLESVDIIFHLAGIAHQQAKPEDYDLVNHRVVTQLAKAAEAASVQCFVFLSSVKAMGESVSPLARTEHDVESPLDAYGRSKWQAEADLNREFSDSSMRVRILRPALVYGRETKANLALLSRMVDKGLPRPPDLGARSMISRSDLCALMQAVSLEEKQGVCTFIATDGEAYSTRRIYDALRDARGMGQGISWCPRWVWWLACRLFDVLRDTPDATWNKLFAVELYSNNAVLEATPWRPVASLESTLRVTGGVL
ncbi:MAG: NAD-dependent epimerase/dehydratase family protein [Halioglobus sp.]